jgi:YD repeat-containing protein
MQTYVTPQHPLGYAYDKQGRILSCRHTDGTGYDYTYDEQGREVSYRSTDGTGWDKIYNEQGRGLSYRRADGTGWDYTYDKQGRELSLRRTDGAGWDKTYNEQGCELSYRGTDGTGWDVLAWHDGYSLQANLDGTYTAGCRKNLTRQQALAHWDRSDDRALLFTRAILQHSTKSATI